MASHIPRTSSWVLSVPGKLINNLSCLGFAVVSITCNIKSNSEAVKGMQGKLGFEEHRGLE